MFRLLSLRGTATMRKLSATVVRWRQTEGLVASTQGQRCDIESPEGAPRKATGAENWRGAREARLL